MMTFPPAGVDFNTAGIPEKLASALEEAIRCYSNGCYTASAIMLRKSLELLCEARGAAGSTLLKRLQALAGDVILPSWLVSAMDDLRLLGNDAAHTEVKTFETVGKAEVEAALSLAQELFKAIYQGQELLLKLKALKRTE